MEKWKSEKVLVLIALACMFLSACRGTASVNSNTSTELIRPMRIVTDDLERRVTIPVKITRVVSLAPNLTESIFAVGAGDRLVGVTTFCNYPEQAKEIAKIGDTMNPNMESIIALKPDVVFVSTASQIENFTKTLEANGIAVYVTNPRSLFELRQGLGRLGDIFATTEISNKLVDQLNTRERSLAKKLGTDLEKGEDFQSYDARVGIAHVFVQISKEPLFTIGKTAFLNDVLKFAGGRSVTEDVPSDFPKISKETSLALNPDAIILSESDDNKEPNDAFKNSPAVKNGRVYKVNADLLSRPGPRLVDALEQIARDLHPEKFK